MLHTSPSTPENSPHSSEYLPNDGLADGEPVASELGEQLKTTIHQFSTMPREFEAPTETRHGADVLSVVARAQAWAVGEAHAVVTLDHLLFALAEREVGANTLLACGVVDVTGLEVELLNIVHQLPVASLAAGEQPTVDNRVLAILNHALGYARENGRDITNMADVLEALLAALRKGDHRTPGMAALTKRWPRATQLDETRQALAQINETLSSQPGTIAKVLAEELSALRDRISTLEKPRPLPWYRRLSVLSFALVVTAVSGGAGLWTFGAA